MKELKKSIKRTYTRLSVLSVVVVFGAIGLAQTQKGKLENVADSPAALADTASLENMTPLRTSGSAESAGWGSSFAVVPASASEPVDGSDDAWSIPANDAIASNSPDLPGGTEFDEPSELDFAEPPPMLPEDQFDPLPAETHQAAADEDFGEPAGSFDYALPDSQMDASEISLAEHELPPLDDYDEPPVDHAAAAPDVATSGHELEPAPALLDGDDVPQVSASELVPEQTRSLTPLGAAAAGAGAAAALSDYDRPSDYDQPSPSDEPTDAIPTNSAATNSVSTSDPNDDLDRRRELTSPAPAPASTNSSVNSQPRSVMATPNQLSSEPSGAASVNPATAAGRPGPQTLEGPQTPSIMLEKELPGEIQVGAPTKVLIRVRNVGRVTAEQVVVRDEVPLGTEFVEANPTAQVDANGVVTWEIGSLSPGEEVVVGMQLMPVTEGQIGSVATVFFSASASARTKVTKPQLVIEQTGPREVLLGENVRFGIKISNPGSGAATKVTLEEDVPSGLAHTAGPKLEYEVGTIEPGQTRHLELTLKAAHPGTVTNTLTARADAGLMVQDSIDVEVVAPKLQVGVDGPSRRYLERQATFTVTVANPGTAPAREVELVAQLPQGLKFVSTNNSGYYDQTRHAVVWSLEQLPAGEMGKAQFTAMPIQIGQHRLRVEGQTAAGLQSTEEHALDVDGIAALFFGVADQVDPVEIGGETTYEINIRNQGSKAATNVRLLALVPDGLTPVRGDGPTGEQISGQQVQFEALPQLDPNGQATYRIAVRGSAAGDHRFRIQMTSDDTTVPVIKEESTRVYAD